MTGVIECKYHVVKTILTWYRSQNRDFNDLNVRDNTVSNMFILCYEVFVMSIYLAWGNMFDVVSIYGILGNIEDAC